MNLLGKPSGISLRQVAEVCCLFLAILTFVPTTRVMADDSAIQTIVVQPWQIPSPTNPYPNQSAKPGDVIRFFWENNHTVYIHPSGDCSITDRIFIGQTSPSQYTFTEADAGNIITFACDVGSHCEFGMIFNVTVEANPTDSPTLAPVTEAPSSAPTSAPVTNAPVTAAPVTPVPSSSPSLSPTLSPVTSAPVVVPTTPVPTEAPTQAPTPAPTTAAPVTAAPVTPAPVVTPTTPAPTTETPSTMPSVAPVTPAPVDSPITPAPSAADTPEPTTESPTGAPTVTPASPTGGQPVSVTLRGVRMGLAGVSSFPESTQQTWTAFTGEYSGTSVATDFADTVSDFSTTYDIQSFEIVPLRRRDLLSGDGGSGGLRNGNSFTDRLLQADSSVIIVYDQTMNYVTSDPENVTPDVLATDPFATNEQKGEYVTFLATSDDPNLEMVSGVSDVDVPPQQPTSAPVAAPTNPPTEQDSSPLSTPAIIGIACGGGALLILTVLYFLYCRNRGGGGTVGGSSKYQSDMGDEPPLQVSIREDEVSTLAGPNATGPPTYGDQSVATVDYDYSKAYGGGGDTSVSSAGGTFGSNTQNNQPSALDPASAAATGAAFGSIMSDGASSLDAHYRDPTANMREEVIHIFAPPGKLGVVIDTPDDGAPVVHAVKDSSVIASKIQVGDKLVSVDDEDVTSMTAIKVSKLISRKSANPSRKLTIVRTTVG